MDEWIRRLLRIPRAPAAPAGSQGSARVFRAARGFYYHRLCAWLLRQAFLFMVLLSAVNSSSEIPGADDSAVIAFTRSLVWSVYGAHLLVSLLLIGVDYRLRWYVVTDRSLRIREGVWLVREQTLSYANVQNVSIGQGPLQRLFGIQDLMVHTAGGGTAASQAQANAPLLNRHVGMLRGVDNAEAIRDLILSHVRQLKGAGLGDPDENERVAGPRGPDLGPPASLEAAQQLVQEAKALRAQLQLRPPQSPQAGT